MLQQGLKIIEQRRGDMNIGHRLLNTDQLLGCHHYRQFGQHLPPVLTFPPPRGGREGGREGDFAGERGDRDRERQVCPYLPWAA